MMNNGDDYNDDINNKLIIDVESLIIVTKDLDI